jgi:hypothetical protein
MHIDNQKDHGKGPQGNTADNAITGVLGKKQEEVFKENKTKGELRTVTRGKSLLLLGTKVFMNREILRT